VPSDPDRFRPETVARTSFGTSFRGYDQLEVRGWLSELAFELNRLHERCAELEAQLADAQSRGIDGGGIDEDRLSELVGIETARVLQAARDAATEIRGKAEENVARMLREAQDEAARLRAQGDADYAKRVDESERKAEEVRQAAEATRVQVLDGAAAELDASRAEGRSMVEEAQRHRERVLEDLARRRKQARQQVEQLRAGRQRLIDAYGLVQESLDDATRELHAAWPDSRPATDGATVSSSGPDVDESDDVDRDAFAAPAATDTATPADETSPTPEAPAEPAGPGASSGGAATDSAAPVPDDDVVAPLTLPPARERGGRRRRTPPVAHQLPEAELVPLRTAEPYEVVRLVDSADDAQGSAAVAAVAIIDVEVEAPAELEADAEGAEGEGDPAVKVDELFARIRASRDDEVAEAREVLAAAAGEDEAGADAAVADAEPEPAPVDEAAALRLGVLERRDAATDAVEARLARRLKRTLADEQNEVLDALRRARTGRAADVLPAVAVQSARYARAASGDLQAAAAAGIAFYDGADTGGQAEVDDLATELAEVIVGLLRERVERAVNDADGEPDSDEVAERIRACYREWKTQRIGDTARHYVLAAFNRGVYAAHPETVALCWVVDDGGAPCPDAEDNALAGPTAKGSPFPTGHLLPPAHPGCRCLIAPDGLLNN
jgi:cell division septum initiation protein DivIVA